MIETINDFLSIATMIFFVIMGIYFVYRVFAKHHERFLRQLEYEYYEEGDDNDDTYE